MRANRSESDVERRVRSALHRRGLRFRKHLQVVAGLRCRPDVVFPAVRTVVFVDGCFWHRCQLHATDPKANGTWWQTKLQANVDRDRRHDQALQDAGWTVLRFWEHEPPEAVADAVQAHLGAARGASGRR